MGLGHVGGVNALAIGSRAGEDIITDGFVEQG
jgi:hypothetical protein